MKNNFTLLKVLDRLALNQWNDTKNRSITDNTKGPKKETISHLVSYAKSCGIGNSIRFLSKQALNIKKITTTKTPDKLIADLADYKLNNPDSKLAKLHLYPFGGMKKTSQWMNSILENPIKIKDSNEFETIIIK